MLDDTEIFVRDRELIVRWQEGASWSRIDIALPVVRGVTNMGAGSIDVDYVRADRFLAILQSSGGLSVGSMNVGQFKAELDGSGSLGLGEINAKTVEVDLMGSGEMRAAGKVGMAELRLGSSGSFENPGFIARDASIISAASGSLRATVTNTAKITALASGAIVLTGGAKCEVRKAGSGDVHCS